MARVNPHDRNGPKREISSAGFMPEVPKDTRSLLDMKRPLFAEDLNPREDARLQQARQDHTMSMTSRNAMIGDQFAAKSIARSSSPAEKKDARAAAAGVREVGTHLRDFSETRAEVSARIAHGLTHPNRAMALRGEGVPGASWYPDHNKDIHHAIENTGVPIEHATVSSGSMSPLNGPANEVMAVGGLARAQGSNARTNMTAELASRIGKVSPKAAKNLPKSQVGRSVGFHELHPEVISAMTQVNEPQDDTELDASAIKRAGTNKTKGVRGIRGESNNSINPPLKAPKVNTYTHNGLVFNSKDPAVKDEIDFRAGDAVNRQQEKDLGAKSNRTPSEEATLKRLPSPSHTPMDFHNTHDDSFTAGPEHADVFKRFGVSAPAGTKAMRDMHPAQVMALSHPSNPDPHSRRLAQLSSQMPTVQDSWANALMHNQPNKSIGNTNVYKAGGSERLGYWQTKALANGTEMRSVVIQKADKAADPPVEKQMGRRIMDVNTPILDKTRPGHGSVTPAALQHAEYDKVTRMAASHVRDSLQLPYDYPSTIAQASPWVEKRREASGKDRDFENKRFSEINKGQRADASSAPVQPGEHLDPAASPLNSQQFAPKHVQGKLF